MTRTLTVGLLLLATMAVAQPAEKSPKAKASDYVTVNSDAEQLVLSAKGPVGVILMRGRASQTRVWTIVGIAIGLALTIFGSISLVTERDSSITLVIVVGVVLVMVCVWFLAGAAPAAVLSVLKDGNIPVLQ